MKKYYRKWRLLLVSLILAVVTVIGLSTMVLATADITDFKATNVTNTTISLAWTPITAATTIRYSTTDYPDDPTTGGTKVLDNGSGSAIVVTGLSAGTNYYFSAWAYDGANYSTNACNLLITTQAVGSLSAGDPFPMPTIPSNLINPLSEPSVLEDNPFYPVIRDFLADWGMPAGNGWMGIFIICAVGLGLFIYGKYQQVMAGFVAAEFVLGLGLMMGLIPWYLLIIPLFFAFGVWSIERSNQ